MGDAASACSTTVRSPSACEVVEGVCPRPRLQRYRNRRAAGLGGELLVPQGRVACLVVAFDYEGYPAEEMAGCGPLACVADGRRFADLAGASRAEVREFYDQPMVPGNLGFPRKQCILEEIRTLGSSLGPNDFFIFYYAGHGKQLQSHDDQGDDGSVEQLCFVEPDGTPNCLSSDELAMLILQEFRPDTHILFVTDCCHAGTLCDFSRPEFNGRPICYLSAVRSCPSIEDLAAGGAFTISLLQTIALFVRRGEKEFSIIEVFNACFGGSDWPDMQDIRFERTHDLDPDTFAWPLVPMRGWQVRETLDHEARKEQETEQLDNHFHQSNATSTLQEPDRSDEIFSQWHATSMLREEMDKLEMHYKHLQAVSVLRDTDMHFPGGLGMPAAAMAWPRQYRVGGA